jgi:ankyrin repeat protein
LVQALLGVGADVDIQDVMGMTALGYAEQHNQTDIIALLRNAQASQEAASQSAVAANSLSKRKQVK